MGSGRQASEEEPPPREEPEPPVQVIHRHHHHHYHHHYFPDQEAEPGAQQFSHDVLADTEEWPIVPADEGTSGEDHRHLHDHHHTGELTIPPRARRLLEQSRGP